MCTFNIINIFYDMYTLFIFQDLLLLKATANSTLSCLGQCLRMLEHRQVGILTIYFFTYENIGKKNKLLQYCYFL